MVVCHVISARIDDEARAQSDDLAPGIGPGIGVAAVLEKAPEKIVERRRWAALVGRWAGPGRGLAVEPRRDADDGRQHPFDERIEARQGGRPPPAAPRGAVFLTLGLRPVLGPILS